MDDAGDVLTRHKLDVDAYYRMAQAGILHEGDRVELIEGEIIDMTPIGESHAATVGRLTQALVLAFAGRALVWPQNPVRIDRLNEPQPDLAILRRREDFYETAKPGPADVVLLIEVADSSLRYDRTVKLPLYARAGIGEVWIVDLQRRVVDAYRRPGRDGYANRTTYQPDETITLALAPDISIGVAQIFGEGV